jgi:hypothetical protein
MEYFDHYALRNRSGCGFGGPAARKRKSAAVISGAGGYRSLEAALPYSHRALEYVTISAAWIGRRLAVAARKATPSMCKLK